MSVELTAKDIIALVVIVGIFVLIGLDKVTWEMTSEILSGIVFYYLGFKTAEAYYRRLVKGEA